MSIKTYDLNEECIHRFERSNGCIVCLECGEVKERIMTREFHEIGVKNYKFYEVTHLLGSQIGNFVERKLLNCRVTIRNQREINKYIGCLPQKFYFINLFTLSKIQKISIYNMIQKHEGEIKNSIVFGAMCLWMNGISLKEIFEVMSNQGHYVTPRLLNLCVKRFGYKPPVFRIENYVSYYLKKLKMDCSEQLLKILTNVSKKIWKLKGGFTYNSVITAFYLILHQTQKLTQEDIGKMFGVKMGVIQDTIKAIKTQRVEIVNAIRKNLQEIGELEGTNL